MGLSAILLLFLMLETNNRFYCFPGSAAVVVAYGHLGDGNVHLNISAREYDNEVLLSFSSFR